MRPSGVRRLLGLVALLLLLLPQPGSTPSEEKVNGLEGGSVQLRPKFGSRDREVHSFVWKRGQKRVAVVEPPGPPRYYGSCEGRCELDTTSGALTLRGLKLNDADKYTAEVDIDTFINQNNVDLRVYPRLRRPSLNCLEADGELTIRCIHTPEPPTYLWVSSRLGPLTGADPDYRLGDGNKTLKIQREKAPLLGSLQCVVKNPVTENRTAVASQCLIEDWLTPPKGDGEMQKEEKEKTVRGRLGVVVTVIVVVWLVVFAVYKWCNVARAERRRKQQARGETRGEREREKMRKENKEQSGGGNNKQEERREEKGKEKKVEKEKKIEDL